jgi:hypothetical protein
MRQTGKLSFKSFGFNDKAVNPFLKILKNYGAVTVCKYIANK